jgi:hypothetical protein
MWTSFFLENAHFALNLFVALVLFAIAWLYFDVWTARKKPKEGLKALGALLVSISYVIHATLVESTIITNTAIGADLNSVLTGTVRIIGYMILLSGLLSDPLEPRPNAKAAIIPILKPFTLLPVFYPFLAAATGFTYLRRATTGLENHLKPVALGFYLLALADLLGLASLLRITTNIDVYNIVAPFGWIWFIENIILLGAAIIFAKWVYYYLLKSLTTQLFMIFTTTILIIFLITTTTFTGLLLKSLQDETLSRLDTDAKVLNFAVDGKKSGALSDTELLAQNPTVISSLIAGTRDGLSALAESIIVNKKDNLLVILNNAGIVQARGEDKERIGDSLSEDQLVKKALLGTNGTSIIVKDGALSPTVSVRAISAVKSEGKIIGAVMAGVALDNTFVDGVKNATGLEAGIYGDNVLSATTIVGANGTSRYLGIKLEDKNIKDKLLQKGESYSGPVNYLTTPYFASYLPLKDVDSNPVGILFVGKPQVGVLATAGHSIELTFILAAVMLAISILPSYLISKYLAGQLK